MDNTRFYDSFGFVRFSYNNCAHTDNSGGIPFHFLAVLRSGSAHIVTEDNEHLYLSAGDVFYLPLGLRYNSYWYPQEDGSLPVELDSLRFLLLPIRNGKNYDMQKLEVSEKTMEMIDAICESRHVNSSTVGLLYSVLGDLIPTMKEKILDKREIVLRRAKRYISEHPSFTVGELARHCHMSESSLYAFFKTYAHTTPIDMKNKMQADRAVILLRTTDISVEEVSERVGFCSTTYFRKIIKDRTGKTPSQIRKERLPKFNV